MKRNCLISANEDRVKGKTRQKEIFNANLKALKGIFFLIINAITVLKNGSTVMFANTVVGYDNNITSFI